MRTSFLISFLLVLSGCEHIGLIFKPPATIKAVIEGRIKGVEVRCEKVLNLGRPKWELMCKVSDEIDIKYRTKNIGNNQTKLELVIDKSKEGKRKIIAAPVMIVKKGKTAEIITASRGFSIGVKAEARP